MKGFIKKLFGRKRNRCVSVRATLTPEKMLVAGNVTVEVPRAVCREPQGRASGLLIRVGGDLAIAVDATDRNDSFGVRCWSTGGRVPQLVTTAGGCSPSQGENAEKHFKPIKMNPLKEYSPVQIGPGGDYVQNWP